MTFLTIISILVNKCMIYTCNTLTWFAENKLKINMQLTDREDKRFINFFWKKVKSVSKKGHSKQHQDSQAQHPPLCPFFLSGTQTQVFWFQVEELPAG